jgi:hypothetical protein
MENARAMAKGGVASKLPWVDGHKESQPGRKEQRQREIPCIKADVNPQTSSLLLGHAWLLKIFRFPVISNV